MTNSFAVLKYKISTQKNNYYKQNRKTHDKGLISAYIKFFFLITNTNRKLVNGEFTEKYTNMNMYPLKIKEM